ncbi:MAG: InlB B-repeat-containing protein [Lachnospiraceae bacterium]|nr:InlB B-repeat-containing protein [Lachnospiraceae bacterium]
MSKTTDRRRTTYGSGTLYALYPTGITIPTTPAAAKTLVETYSTEENQLGYLKNGMTITIDTETLSDQSDLGEMKIDLITKETGTAETTVFNVNGETVSRVYPTATYNNGCLIVGGLNGVAQDAKLYIFVEANVQNGKQQVVVFYGKNTSGFTIQWTPDGVQPFAINLALEPFNTQGNLVSMNLAENLPSLPITSDTTYSITYEMNGGEWAASYEAPDSYQHGTGSDITLPTSSNIAKDGATFAGWFETSDLSTAVTTIDVSEDSGNKTFYAKWTT